MTTITHTPRVIDNPPAPGSEAWQTSITASKVPSMIRDADGKFANLGYLTAWEVYEQIKGRYTPEHTDFMLARFERAHDEEQPACEWWVAQQDKPEDWMLSESEVAFYNPEVPFLTFVTIDRVATHLPTGERTRLEVKNPEFPGLQPGWFFQSEIGSGLKGGIIVSPVNGEREWHPTVVTDADKATVIADIAHFAFLLATDTAPEDGDKQVPADLLARLEDAKAAKKIADAALKAAKEEVEHALGINRRLLHGDKVVAYRSEGKFSQGRVPKEHAAALEDPEVFTTVNAFDAEKFHTKYPDLYEAAIGAPTITVK